MKTISAVLGLAAAAFANAAHAVCPGEGLRERPALSRPVNGKIFSGFGLHRHPILGYTKMHTGVDFEANVGDPVRAAAAGKVAFAGTEAGYDRYVRLRHASGYETAYVHLGRILVREGDCVGAGALIGRIGSTSLRARLHFEVRINDRFVDPAPLIGARTP